MTTQDFLRELLERTIPADGIFTEDVSFIVEEVSTRHVVVASAQYPEVKFSLDIRQPAARPDLLKPLEHRTRTVVINITPGDLQQPHEERMKFHADYR